MKLISFFGLLSLLFCLSCSQNDEEPLSLHQIENNSIQLFYGTKSGVTIIGGDGNYSYTSDSPLIKGKMTHTNYILFEPLGVGEATVTIRDGSGHSYILTISICYRTEHYTVKKTDAFVSGDNMTVGEQKELKEKALSTIPVKVGGGYEFVFTAFESDDKSSGIVSIYPTDDRNNFIEGTFETTLRKDENQLIYRTYTLHYQSTERTFVLMQYKDPLVKMINTVVMQFAEDVKGQFLPDYPEVEQVYTSQIVSFK